MAQTQVKPKTSGSFTNVTGNGKTTTGIATLAPGQRQMAIYASNLFTLSAGVAGARTTAANKHADAAGVLLQWA